MGLPAFAFDSLEFVKELEVAGISRTQAEAQAHALSKVFEANIKELATKDNLQNVETNLRRDIADLRKDMESNITDLRKDVQSDIADLRKDMRSNIADLRKEMESRFDILSSQMIIRLGSMVLGAIVAIPFIFKLFHLL